MTNFLDQNLFEADEDVGIDLSEGIYLPKRNSSKECIDCNYWFFNHGLKYQNSICNGCHDLTMLCLNISNIAIVTTKAVDYLGITYDIIIIIYLLLLLLMNYTLNRKYNKYSSLFDIYPTKWGKNEKYNFCVYQLNITITNNRKKYILDY